MTWTLVFTKHAQKNAPKLASAGLKTKAQALLLIPKEDPFQKTPPYEKLVGDLSDASTYNIGWSIKCCKKKT